MVSLRGVQKGVSLTEVLIALFILSVVGAVIVAGVFVAVKGNDVSRTHIVAEGLARYELEYLKDVCTENWTVAPWAYTLPGPPAPPWDNSHIVLPSGYEGFSVTVSAEPLTGAPYFSDNRTQKVTAAVFYAGKSVLSIEQYLVQQ
ncbi:MAG: prepilin-type N-terminal cleavage/methylation domain-containing protein [Dehalococcoidia bacterium]|jgi:type II secretory pathway pseudopilin PulG